MPNHPETVLALDPGLRDLGWAVVRGSELLDAGVQTTRELPQSERHRRGLRAVRTWIERYEPEVLVLEQIALSSHPSFGPLHRWARAVMRLATRRGISPVAYHVQAVRKALLSTGWGSKAEAAAVIAARYPQLRLFLRQDRAWKERYFHNMFDAIALGLHHTTRR